MTESLGRTEAVCKEKLLSILRDGLSKEEKEGLINMWSKKEPDPDAKFPAEFSLQQLCNMEGIAVGLLAPSQRYNTIEGEEVCQL